jgi:hypothetical protein
MDRLARIGSRLGRHTGRGEAWYRARFGAERSPVRIRPPRLVREPRTAANTGEYPRKGWTSGERVRSCSRLFVGLETANGPQRTRKGTAKGPQPSGEQMRDNHRVGESSEIELVRRAWDALAQDGPEVLGEVLAPDAQWYSVEDGQLCDGRKAIIDVMSRNLPGRLRGRIEETIQDGSRVIVAFRPEQPAQLDRPVREPRERWHTAGLVRAKAPVSVVVVDRVAVDGRFDRR